MVAVVVIAVANLSLKHVTLRPEAHRDLVEDRSTVDQSMEVIPAAVKRMLFLKHAIVLHHVHLHHIHLHLHLGLLQKVEVERKRESEMSKTLSNLRHADRHHQDLEEEVRNLEDHRLEEAAVVIIIAVVKRSSLSKHAKPDHDLTLSLVLIQDLEEEGGKEEEEEEATSETSRIP